MVVYQLVNLDGDQGCQRLIHALRRTNLQEMDLEIRTNIDTLDPTLLQQFDDALDGNASLEYMNLTLELQTNDAANATSSILARLVSLKPLVNLNLNLGNNIVSAAAGLSLFFNGGTAGSVKSSLEKLSIAGDVLEGDFAQGWAALQQNQTLETLEFNGTNFDASNTEALLECLKTVNRDNLAVTFGRVDVNNPDGLTVALSSSTFGEASQGAVAASIFVSTPNLRTVGFSDSNTDDANANANSNGLWDLLAGLSAESTIPKSPPRLVLHVNSATSVNALSSSPTAMAYLRHLEVQHDQFQQPPLPDEVALQAAIQRLDDAVKRNGSLHSFVGGSAKAKAYGKRNRNVPKIFLKARKHHDAKCLIPTLFVASMHSPMFRASTILAALKEKDIVRGPSLAKLAEAAKASAMKGLDAALAAYAAAIKVSLDSSQMAAAARTALDGAKGRAGVAQAVERRVATAVKNAQGGGVNYGDMDRDHPLVAAVAVHVAVTQDCVRAQEEVLAATTTAEECTQQADGAAKRAEKAAKKVAKMEAALAAFTKA